MGSLTITGGVHRGRKLQVPAGRTTRPTRSLVRQALFNMLGDAVRDATVLDLYSGSGALGLEALSRGAARVVFVERDRRALTCLRGNLRACGEGAQRARVAPVDVASFAPGPEAPYDVITGDPPFALRDSLPPSLEAPGVLSPDAVLVLHLPAGASAAVDEGRWELLRERTYGRSAVHFYTLRQKT